MTHKAGGGLGGYDLFYAPPSTGLLSVLTSSPGLSYGYVCNLSVGFRPCFPRVSPRFPASLHRLFLRVQKPLQSPGKARADRLHNRRCIS